ncbi:glycoside hydrolase family 2 TIM barrel-domain containing protein [Marinimicrobium alkaliphilum]|uniref:glycoside hydrolase family 2 TIM barrel-domain containing protein n=1 Tax=Marinimicrobium alkaliphilum TaxID=2202654 RepID=UPI0018E08E17|nr:glycoside hydrolase family 2 TIM barrel-domain containing protein [Marinimicrobium alkaliphilum]
MKNHSIAIFKVSVVLCASLLFGLSACATESSARETTDLKAGWRFSFGEAGNQAVTSDFDDSSWESVEVPHSWNRVGYYTHDLYELIHQPDNINNDQGEGWYRLEFTGPADLRGKRAWLEFDAASRTAEVWLNGARLGEHRGGFTRFRFDITETLKPGEDNLLVVKTDNTRPTVDSSTADVHPIAGDFFVHGGIYRPVRLVLTDSVHFDMLDFGGPGVYASTTRIDDDQAEIRVRARLRNTSQARETVSVISQLVDDQGTVVATNEEDITLEPGDDRESNQVLKVDKPILWHGVENPYLYTLRAELRTGSGEVRDRLDQSFGIREVAFDADRGFILNGKPYRLRGVSYHQDHEGKGWAVSEEDIAKDVDIIREMGANTVRLAHYPHGQPVHELANRYGLILWDEIPLVTSWGYDPDDEETNRALDENAKQQLREMIRQNFNHPSVAAWGTANEVDFGALLPLFLGNTVSDVNDLKPLLAELSAIVAAEDPSRASVLAHCCERREGMEEQNVPVTSPFVDLAGANLYFGWYYGQVEDLGPHLDKLRQISPNQPLSVSEYGAGGAISQYTDNPLGGPIDERGETQPEDFMSNYHEESWAIISQKPYLWGSWVWNGFDFATSVRREGDAIDINTKGLVTYDRAVKKDAFYFYKAHWSESETVYITNRRYVDRAYPITNVRVYSNATKTELKVNGRSYGVLSSCPNKVCEWNNIRLSAGVNAVEARGTYGEKTTTDSVEWHLDERLEHAYRIGAGAVLVAESSLGRFGSDNFFSGGTAKTVDQPGGWGRPPVETAIANTEDRELAAAYREGDFVYRVPLENGKYRVSLTFMEPDQAPGSRLFNVLANEDLLLENFDVAEAAGKKLTAITRQFTVTATHGAIELAFKPVSGEALVSAIVIERVAEGSE